MPKNVIDGRKKFTKDLNLMIVDTIKVLFA